MPDKPPCTEKVKELTLLSRQPNILEENKSYLKLFIYLCYNQIQYLNFFGNVSF